MIDIRIKEQTLTDGSKVYDVFLFQDGVAIRLPAYTKQDAWWLSEKLSCAIREHASMEANTDAW